MEYNYIAYDAAVCEYEFFKTFEDAKKWLIDDQDFSDGIPEEFGLGHCCIAKITHRTEVKVTDKKEYYHEHTDDCPEDCDEEEWPYDSDFDYVGNVVLKHIENKGVTNYTTK